MKFVLFIVSAMAMEEPKVEMIDMGTDSRNCVRLELVINRSDLNNGAALLRAWCYKVEEK